MISVTVVSRKGKEVASVEVDTSITVDYFKKLVHKSSSLSPERQYLTLGEGSSRVALKNHDQTVVSYGVHNGAVLTVKDLGPQIGWRTVFVIEYFGPLLIHLALYLYPSLFYGVEAPRSELQTLACVLCAAHYLKRELESVFVHRFSSGTMPLFNVFKNSFHYWVLGGLAIAYPLYHPDYTQYTSTKLAQNLASLFLICMFGNLKSHIILKNLRPAGSTKRDIPRGFLFEYVSCPNYFFEIVQWVTFACMVQTITSAVFAVVSACQMYIWALGKHKQYKKEFNGKNGKELYPRGRKVLIPFLL